MSRKASRVENELSQCQTMEKWLASLIEKGGRTLPYLYWL